MADWGPFVQGLAGTLPQVGFQTYAIRQRDEALARQEKQLNEQIKKQEINEAQQTFLKGIELVDKLSPEVSSHIINSMIKPSIMTLDKHKITSYGEEGINDFITQMNENPSAAKAIAKDLKAITQMKGSDGKPLSGKEVIKQMNMVISAHSARLSKEQKESLQGMVSEAAMSAYPEASAEDKPYIGAHMTAPQQKAFGIGDNQTVSDFAVFYRGYKEKNPKATESEISEAWGKEQARRAKDRIQISVNSRAGEMSEEAIKQEGIKYAMTGKMPALGMGNAQMRSKIINAAAAWLKEQGVDPTDVPGLQADVTGEGKSLANQQKIRGMMGGFVRNMDKQIDRVERIHTDIAKRVGVRALDMPIRELRKRFMGSGNEAILEAYMVEISNEIGKLSTGSAASIRELSVDAQERWAKIHDPNLSFNELIKILKETKHMGKLRLQGADEEIQATKGRMKKPTKTNETEDPLGIR